MTSSPRPPWTDAGPRRRWIGEGAFRQPLMEAAEGFLRALSALQARPPETWTEAWLSEVSQQAEELERFLDAHGARRNKTFYPIRKSVACLLWLSQATSCLAHLRGRLGVYPTACPSWTEETLPHQLDRTVHGLGMEMVKVTQALKKYWVASDLEWPTFTHGQGREEPPPLQILSANRAEAVDAEDQDDTSPGARLATRFLRFLNAWTEEVQSRIQGTANRIRFVEENCRERTTRSFQVRAHNWQSDYDSLVRGSKEEQAHPGLEQLRGSMSQALHLLEANTALSHLFERHRPGLPKEMGPQESNFLEGEAFLGLWIEGCVVPAYRSLQGAREAAEEVLSSLTQRTSVLLDMPSGVQFHARPLSLVVQVVQHHGLPVQMEMEGESVTADSLIQLLLIAGKNPESTSFRFIGDARPLADLEDLVAARFGEDGVESLPSSLNYLKK